MDVYIQQDKFHQIILRRYRIAKLNKSTQTIRRLLCYYQELACSAYPTEAKMSLALGELYDAKFQVSLTSFGSYSLLVYSLIAVDPCYIEDDEYTLEKLESVFEEFLCPKMNKGQANPTLFQRAYEIYESDLLTLLEDTQGIAYQNAILEYFKGTERDFLNYGSLEELRKLTPKNLFEYYQKVSEEETISICTGHVPSIEKQDGISLTPKRNYHFKERGNSEVVIKVPFPSEQCYLCMIYDVGIYAENKEYYACMFLNHILGGGSSSYLFKIVREKYGLCYSIHSTYLGATGIIVISCVLDSTLLKQGIEAIDEAISSMDNLDFELEETRKYYLSNHALGEDYIETAIQNYLGDNFFLDTPKSTSEVKGFQSVTKEEVKKVYKHLKKSFTYILGGKDGK